jgi:hypothetical protein
LKTSQLLDALATANAAAGVGADSADAGLLSPGRPAIRRCQNGRASLISLISPSWSLMQ